MYTTLNKSLLALLLAEEKIVGNYFLGNFCTHINMPINIFIAKVIQGLIRSL